MQASTNKARLSDAAQLAATAEFDLIAIGTGAAASAAALKCRDAGWKVAIIDARPFGGACELRGCDPKNVMGYITLMGKPQK
jgi:pyruvate/2-oxoglutarate dehydrogenase complex dihydrolipoamide dehydrogenase (E3) component